MDAAFATIWVRPPLLGWWPLHEFELHPDLLAARFRWSGRPPGDRAAFFAEERAEPERRLAEYRAAPAAAGAAAPVLRLVWGRGAGPPAD